MLKIIVCIILISPLVSKSQTCIIAKKNKSRFIIGADSRRVGIGANSNGNQIEGFFDVCKIHGENGFYFAFSGMMANGGSAIMRGYCKKAKTNLELCILFTHNIPPYLYDSLAIVKENNESKFQQIIKDSLLQSVIICHFENDTLSLMKIVEWANWNDLAHTQLKINGGYAYDSVFAIGETESINSLIKTPKTWVGNTSKMVQKLIQKEADINKRTVHGPIDIIEINKRGYKWLCNKKSCSIFSN